MDFRTEWSSWVLILIMMIMAYFMKPWVTDSGIGMTIVQVVGYPLAAIAIACIPVLILCYFINRIPDIDYSIRLAFVYMLVMWVLKML